MVESVYTIPLTEALDEDCDCLFCYLEEKIEREQIEYALGAAMMEPDFRILSNEKGYCRHHVGMMARAKKALPLALVLDTRCDEVLKKIKSVDFSKKKRIFQKRKVSLRSFKDGCEQSFWHLFGLRTN
ncbi:MAG: hypothetical protein IJB50_00145 [Clostridia bacterium]|nr:hypothetical protein [Clostridia bacterium]